MSKVSAKSVSERSDEAADPSSLASDAGVHSSAEAADASASSATEPGYTLPPEYILADEDIVRFNFALHKYRKASSPNHITPKELVLYTKVFEALTLARTDSSSSDPLEIREDEAIHHLTQYINDGADLNEILYYPNGYDKEVISPLTGAISFCSPKIIRFLLANRADANLRTPDGVYPLHAALVAKNPKKVALLLDYDANPNFTLNNGLTLIITAIRFNFEEELSTILKHPKSKDDIDLSTKGNKGFNLLGMCLLYGHTALAMAIIKTGKYDLTGFGKLYSFLHYLKENKAIPKAEDASDESVFKEELLLDILKRLTTKGANSSTTVSKAISNLEAIDVDLLNRKQSLIFVKEVLEFGNSSSALIKMAIMRCLDVIFDQGDILEFKDEAISYLSGICRDKKYGTIAIDEVAIYTAGILKVTGKAPYNSLLMEELKILLDAGLSPNHILQKNSLIGVEQLKESCSLFSYVCKYGSPVVVDYLADKGADLESKSAVTLATPIHYAVNGNNLKVVQKLVSLDADVNTLTQNKGTPLLVSILRDFNDIALYLISHDRVDVNQGAYDLFNALNMALIYNNTTVIEALLQRKDLSFEMLPKLLGSLEAEKKGDIKLKSSEGYETLINNIRIAGKQSPENTLDKIIQRFKDFEIPVSCSLQQHFDFAKAMISVSPKKAAKHFNKVSKNDSPENLNLALEATKALVELYTKNSVTEGYKKLYETFQRAKAQELAKFGDRPSNEYNDAKLHLLKAIVDFEFSSEAVLGIELDKIMSQRDKLASTKINKSTGIPDKKIVEESQKVLSVLRFLPESDLTILEKQILKITNPERIEALQKAAKLASENGKHFKQVETNKAKIIEYLTQLNELFKIISAGLTKEEVQSLEKYCNASIGEPIIKHSVSLQRTSVDVSTLEAFNMFGIKPLVKAPVADLASAAPSKPVAKPAIEEKGGAAAGAPSAKKHEHAPEIEINLKTLEKFAKAFDPSSKVEFCEKVKEAIGYEPKPKGTRDKYAKHLKTVLEKEYLDGSNPYGAIKQTFKLVFSKEVPGHFIMAYLHASTDETLESLYDEVVAVDENRSQVTGLTEASTVAKVAAPVEGLKAAGSSLGAVSEHHEEKDDSEKLKLSKLGRETLNLLFEKEYSEISEAGLTRLLNELVVKGYSYVQKKGKYVIKCPNGETIGGHDSHAENVRAGKEDGAIMAIPSFKALRKSLVKNDIIEDPFGEDSDEELREDLPLTEEEFDSLVAAKKAELQASDVDTDFSEAPGGAAGALAFASAQEDAAPWGAPWGVAGAEASAPVPDMRSLIQAQQAMDLLESIRDGIASGNPMIAEIKKLPEAFMILGLERNIPLFKDIENNTVNMVGLWRLLIGRLDHLNGVSPEIIEATIREGEPKLLALWSAEEHHDLSPHEVNVTGDVGGRGGISESKGGEANDL